MINHSHSLLCKKILTDKEGTPSYVDITKSLGTYRLPRELPEVTLVTSWENDSDNLKEISFEVRAVVKSTSGKKLLEKTARTDIIKFSNVHFGLAGVEVKEYGRYVVIVSYKTKKNWKKCIEVPFYLYNPKDEE